MVNYLMHPIDLLVQKAMIPFLSYSYSHFFPNFGVGIILLTLLVKIVFYPLTQKQFQSMKTMQILQPKLKALQEKHKDQPEQLRSALMKFYKDNNFNPFSGCLPALVQLPIFFAIFYTVSSPQFLGLLQAPGVNTGFLWLHSLSVADPFYILPVAIGILTYLSQKMSVVDPQQAKILMFMPFLMVFICFKMPSGVQVYWAASQGLSLAQQYWILRKINS